MSYVGSKSGTDVAPDSTAIRILHLEDEPKDAELIEAALTSDGLCCDVTLVATERDFRSSLESGEFDIVLADYSIPAFDGPSALAVARNVVPGVPFIFVSGAFGEDAAIGSLRGGATDCVLKDRLSRLGPSVKRAVLESASARQGRRAERALLESRKRLELALKVSGVGVWSWDERRDRFQWDERMVEIFRMAEDRLPYDLQCFLGLVHEDDREEVESRFQDALRTRTEFHIEYRFIDGAGVQRYIASRAQFVADETDDQFATAVGGCWDVSDQKREEERRSLLSTVLESAANAIMIVDADGRITWVNRAFAELTGYTRAEVLGKSPRILKSGKHDDAFYRQMWTTIANGSTWHGHIINRRKDGSLYTEEQTISPVRGAYGETVSFVSMKRDISLEVDLTRQLHQAQKLEAVGRLAGGVAHDFNNMLTVIAGNAELALADIAREHPIAEPLHEISDASDRAATLTRQLLAFSRKQILQPRVLELNALVMSTERMLHRLIGEDIKLSTKLDPELGMIKADPSQLEQILMNLAVNARDAMPRGGELIFETDNIEINETRAGRGGVRMSSGSYVRLTITDTGEGMDEETQARVFEPFFTTKGSRKGTGLGLSTVYGIVKQSGGYIWIDSAPQEGASFKVYFPLVDDTPKQTEEKEAVVHTRGGETILLVEDEKTVLKLARSILERAGYTVLTANNGVDALRWIRGYEKPIHLLVTDVVMPEMSGRALADRIQPLRRDLPVLYTSGYTDDAIVHHGVLDSGAKLLEKPYSRDSLLIAVRTMLDAPRTKPAR